MERVTLTTPPEGKDLCRKPDIKTAGLFSFTSSVDYLLMFYGAVGCCIHGATLPVFFILFGRMIDSLGSLSSDPHRLASEVSKHALHLVYLGLVIMASAWKGVSFWMQTGERQTTCLRIKYVQSILKQDMTFFDIEARDENIIYRISSDAVQVQDAIGNKIGHCLRYLSQFFVGFIVGFASVWQLTLLTLAVVPLMVVAGGTYTIIMADLSEKGEAAYAEAGKVAEEVLAPGFISHENYTYKVSYLMRTLSARALYLLRITLQKSSFTSPAMTLEPFFEMQPCSGTRLDGSTWTKIVVGHWHQD